MLFGLGLYQYDDVCEAMDGSYLKIVLNGFELVIMGPAMGCLAYVLSERFRQRDEDARRHLEQEREGRFLLLGKIAASVAHEIRNPLHNLRLVDEELRAEAPEHIRHLVDRIDGNLDRLDEAVQLAYELARPRRGPDDPDVGLVEVDRVISLIISDLGRRFEKISVHNHLPNQRVRVYSHPGSIRIAFGNLIKNALEATTSGAIQIAYECIGSDWNIRITNAGHLPVALLSSDYVLSSNKPNGLGVGLGIAKHLISNVGGFLSLEEKDNAVITTVSLRAA